ncbi:MAG: hypothetical protein J6Y07_04590 [Alphaproteobacteria bacterium]|nr:hypothetical protein [Alphaproteobacteria bacterium]
MFTANWFFDLEKKIKDLGADSDAQSFDEIREMLSRPRRFSADEFATMCVYVILAGGFSQKTAKRIHKNIMEYIYKNGANFDALFQIFHNKNKVSAICKIWENRTGLCNGFYNCATDSEKLIYLSKLPHIGKITANHLGRNLGIDVVKYDVWIRRLGALYAGISRTDDLTPEIKTACDDMFAHLVHETNLPRGYIDVVLWKACQLKLISMDFCLRSVKTLPAFGHPSAGEELATNH